MRTQMALSCWMATSLPHSLYSSLSLCVSRALSNLYRNIYFIKFVHQKTKSCNKKTNFQKGIFLNDTLVVLVSTPLLSCNLQVFHYFWQRFLLPSSPSLYQSQKSSVSGRWHGRIGQRWHGGITEEAYLDRSRRESDTREQPQRPRRESGMGKKRIKVTNKKKKIGLFGKN